MKKKLNQVSKKVQIFRPIGAMVLLVALLCSVIFGGMPIRAEAFTPSYVQAYEGQPTYDGVGYSATEVSAHANQLISGQRVKVTAAFDGFQIYMANLETYHFTLSVYKWTDSYAATIAKTPLKTISKTMTHGNVQAESLTWIDGDLSAGEYLFVVENPTKKDGAAARLGVAGVSSNKSKGEFYRLGTVVNDMELALDIHFTEAEPTEGYFADVYKPTYVSAYEGKPTYNGVGYSATEVSAHANQLISGQRVRVTAAFDGFQIYMANLETYHFTLSVYKWTDSYAVTIAKAPLKTISKTMTHGNVQAESLTWIDGALPAGEYLFVVENPTKRDGAVARLGVAGVSSNKSKGEFYRLGTVVNDMELALDIHFTEAEPTRGYFADVYNSTYVSAYEGKPTYDGVGYSATEVSAHANQLISGQRVRVTAAFDGFQIYMANLETYHFTLSVYKWTDSYAATIAKTPLKTISKTMTHGNVQAESLTWIDGDLSAGEYLFVVENPTKKDGAAARLGVAGVSSNKSKGEFYRLGTVVNDMELALDIHFTEAEPTEGYFADVYKPTYVSAYEGKPTYDGVGYSTTEVSAHANQLISGQRVRVTAAFDGFQIYMANLETYHFTLSVYKWTDSYAVTIAKAPLKTISKTMTHGNVQAESLTWIDGALPAGEYLFVVENPTKRDGAVARLGVAGVSSNKSKGEFYRLGTVVNDMELALDIRFTEEAPAGGYFKLAKDIILGDINLDGDVNIIDLVSLKKKVVNGTGDIEIHDLNRDSKVDADDLALLRKYLVGAIDFSDNSSLASNELPMVSAN